MVKIVVDDRNIAVFVDPRNRGEWEECVVIEDIPLPEGWAREAHVGLTASTGQLVDNHDIISLVTYAGKYSTSFHFTQSQRFLICLALTLPWHIYPSISTLHYLLPFQPDHAVMEREEAKKYSQTLFELAPKNMYDAIDRSDTLNDIYYHQHRIENT